MVLKNVLKNIKWEKYDVKWDLEKFQNNFNGFHYLLG